MKRNTSQKIPFLDRLFQRILRAPIGMPQVRKHVAVRISDVLYLYRVSLRNFSNTVMFLIVSAILASVTSVLIPYFFKRFLDVISVGYVQPSSFVNAMTALYVIIGLSVLHLVLIRTNFLFMGGLASRMIADLKQRAFAKLMAHSDRFFASAFSGSLVQRVNRFASSYDRIADRFLYNFIPIIIQITGVIIVLATQNITLALIIIVWLIVFLGWNWGFARWKLKYDAARAEADSYSTGYLSDAITNHQTVELSASHLREEGGYRIATGRQALLQRFSWQSGAVIDGVQAVFVLLAEFAVLYVGLRYWREGNFSLGLFVLVQSYIVNLSDQLWNFSRMIRDLHEAFADAKEMAEIMLLPEEIVEAPDAIAFPFPKGKVEFRGVRFRFQDHDVLHDISFTIAPGEKVALVGPSGAGKSTIIKLLFRQYDPTDGVILIDDIPENTITLSSLRNALCLVPQDPVLFHRTLRENIRYARPDASDREVEAAAAAAFATEFIAHATQGYDTYVGERGIKLSGGERQRVAIARAFLKASPILVFDEATSSLDSEAEQKIQAALDLLMVDRTTIVIAHRLSTIRRMDRIIVIDQGRVVESGTHDELLAKEQGVYWKLWTLQQGGFLGDDSVLPVA